MLQHKLRKLLLLNSFNSISFHHNLRMNKQMNEWMNEWMWFLFGVTSDSLLVCDLTWTQRCCGQKFHADDVTVCVLKSFMYELPCSMICTITLTRALTWISWVINKRIRYKLVILWRGTEQSRHWKDNRPLYWWDSSVYHSGQKWASGCGLSMHLIMHSATEIWLMANSGKYVQKQWQPAEFTVVLKLQPLYKPKQIW